MTAEDQIVVGLCIGATGSVEHCKCTAYEIMPLILCQEWECRKLAVASLLLFCGHHHHASL